MKSNIVILWILTAYFVIVGGVYVVWNWLTHGYIEWAGTMAIIGGASLGALIAVYLMLVQKKQGGVLIEDRENSDIDDGDPEIGEFSPWSWWPVMLSGSVALGVLGMCIGFNFWLSYLSIPLIIVSIVGWVYEYYRGYFAR